ncbi:response regulator transcription factor [Bacteroides sp. 51]|uniref:response regulator transcription factor n=1 Tax=Bacteroides sp. 51 TaxID=2302938 RepID=UPI0013D16A05|nr:response regulator transcription factor [Bacteroides sp. 51]NDV82109.1 DNA-binding response regulator [Bacteroides sp. 51]
MIKLLLVEDDVNLSYMIRGSLEDMVGGYEVITAHNGKDGIALWKKHKPDVIIADIEMPEMNGFEMVEKIRAIDGDTLILFASGRISPKDVSAGYKLGANNYVKKPFVPEELDHHIKALLNLKNCFRARNKSQIQKIGIYSFDAINGTLKDAGGERIPLTSTESKILELLVMNRGETIKREDILEQLWDVEGKDYFASRRFDTFITVLRKKLNDPSVKIETVRGVGVRLNE